MFAALAYLTLACSPAPQDLVEDFNQTSANWSATIFPNVNIHSGGAYRRHVLNGSHGMPTGTPELPIQAQSDRVGRYYELNPPGTSGTAYTGETYANVAIDGYLAIAHPDPFGSQFAGFMLRVQAGGGADVSGYHVGIFRNGGPDVSLSVSYMCSGVIQSGSVLQSSIPFPADFSQENFRLRFSAVGNTLTASLWRVHVVANAVVETPVDLLADPGVQGQIVVTDERFGSGHVGLSSFARGGNSALYDDIVVSDLGAGPGTVLCGGDGSTLPCPCGNGTDGLAGCANGLGIGARLTALGSTSLAADDLRLTAGQLEENTFGLLFAGDTMIAVPFGNGLRCAGGFLVRFPVRSTTACGAISEGQIASRLGVSAGETRYFQAWYRDNLGPCGFNYNTSSALAITFTP